MSDFTGLSAFQAARDYCLVAAEYSLRRAARSHVAAQYLSSLCFGPIYLQNNFFLKCLFRLLYSFLTI